MGADVEYQYLIKYSRSAIPQSYFHYNTRYLLYVAQSRLEISYFRTQALDIKKKENSNAYFTAVN